MAEQPTVSVGQVWEDCDMRAPGRQVKVLRLFSRMEHPRLGPRMYDYSRRDEVWYAECEVVTAGRGSLGRRVTIKVDRFQPTSTGYALVEDAEVTGCRS